MGLRHGQSCRPRCDYDARRLKSIGARISAPVYPGDVLRTEVWFGEATGSAGDAIPIVSFRTTVPARDGVVVLNNGRAEIASAREDEPR